MSDRGATIRRAGPWSPVSARVGGPAMQISSYPQGTPSWVDLGSPDLDATVAFYGGLFGWTSEEGPPEAGGYRMCLLDGVPVAGIGPLMSPEQPPMWTTY